ncbi:AraC family transcriptional regulator [Mesorhizobium sp. CAU 1741]|uniref:helix-turn-helix domain-containing protein n=1 Tax=Mesorhizobium sp. CAU 1741 TaxID=3140366 RepID=UPI00325BEF96
MTKEPLLAAISRRPDATVVSTDTFTLLKVPPPRELEGLVLDIALYRELSGTSIRQVETASLVVPLLIGFSDPFEIALGRAPTRDDGFHSFTAGLCLAPANIISAGACSCLEITLTPRGARRFFGMPMSELTERMVGLGDLGDKSLDRLRHQLGEEDDWDRRLELAEAFLQARLGMPSARPSPTGWAYDRIVASAGRATIGNLADHLGWSRKHLASRFHDEFGLPPKQVARIARFMNAQRLASGGEENGWAEIAAACGYADQAHLTREFRAFSGTTPSAWLSAAAR